MTEDDIVTDADLIRLFANALADTCDHFPVLKLFSPDAGATWLLSESDPDDPDRLFGLCDLGLGYPELGYVWLKEIAALRGPLGLPVERDQHFIPEKPLSLYADEARAKGRVVT